MTTLRSRHRRHREAARQASALRRAMSTAGSRAVRDEMLSTIGR
jgi:hypothetical protein